MTKHISVFKKEVRDNFSLEAGGIMVDLTLGGAGHFKDMLENLESGTVIGFDLELVNITNLLQELQIEPKRINTEIWDLNYKSLRVFLVNRNFASLTETLSELQITGVDGILADLGWSTDQLDSIPGLSFKDVDANLDMRFSPELSVTAADLLNGLGERELLTLFERYADIVGKQAKDLVRGIIDSRKGRPFTKVGDVIEILNNKQDSALHRGSRELGALPARIFQALRIAVNQELSTLQSMLPQAWESLRSGGILQLITFHSGEEKLVRQQLEEWSVESCLENINKSEFLRPSVDELRTNLAARSAKLWSIKKC
jgi:16S rRNA (cytosine1402-N4)-methyltransferase